jgi:NitT/TauT family transport system substrate-binding protein
MFARKSRLLALLLAATMLAACDQGPSSPTPVPEQPTVSPNRPAPTAPAGLTPQVQSVPTFEGVALPSPDKSKPVKVTIALGYVPDVQFAPFYLALEKGYFSDEGLDVTFKHGIVPDLIKQLGAGDEGVNFAVASGDEVIPARLQGIPVVYVLTWYRQYPVAAVSIKGKGPDLKTPADLKGKTIGIPGPFGSTYTGLLALLKAGGLTLQDVTLKTIGFTQVENLTKGQVDVAMVYAANEPSQLRSAGFDVSTLLVSDYNNLASNGLITNVATFRDNAQLIARVCRATQKGIEDTIKDPQAAFDATLKQVPEAGGTNRDRQLKVLQETVKLMQAKPGDPMAQQPTGWVDVATWAATQDFLYDAKIIQKKGKVQEMFSNRFLVTQH